MIELRYSNVYENLVYKDDKYLGYLIRTPEGKYEFCTPMAGGGVSWWDLKLLSYYLEELEENNK